MSPRLQAGLLVAQTLPAQLRRLINHERLGTSQLAAIEPGAMLSGFLFVIILICPIDFSTFFLSFLISLFFHSVL